MGEPVLNLALKLRDTLASTAAVAAVNLAMATDGWRRWRAMEAMTAEPAKVQAEVLASIIEDGGRAAFGRKHRFDRLAGPELTTRYRSAVPTQNYDSLVPWIEQQEQSGDGLLAERPILFARTSGTTGSPKDIPVTHRTVDRLAATQRLYSYGLHRSTDAFKGAVLGIGGAAVEGHRRSGIPYGSATGLIYEKVPSVVRAQYVLPAEALGIEDYDTKYAVIAAMAMARADLTSIVTANPSTVVRLGDVIGSRWDELLAAVADGDPSRLGGMSTAQASAVKAKGRPRPDRAAQLERLAVSNGGAVPELDSIWPRLAALVGWTGGSCGFALNALRHRLPAGTKLMEYGYSSSEFRGTIGIDTTRFGIPTIWDNFYEFVPVEAREGGGDWSDDVIGIEALEAGQQYYILVTTPDGLYRYDMNDVMEAGPRFGATPTLAFVRKGRGVTNITGEKLTEEQVLAAVDSSADDHGAHIGFFVAVADTAEARYRLYAEIGEGDGDRADVDPEAFGAAIDNALGAINVEYGAKRSSGRLHRVEVHPLRPGAGAAYRRAKIEGGQRDAQFKYLHLQPVEDLDFDFAAHGLLM